MRKALMIAYDYPPRGWSGVQRTVKFVRYLPEFGWEPIVLAPREWYLPGPMDPSMLPEVAHAVTERAAMLTHEDFMRLWKDVGVLLWPALRLFGKDATWFAEGMRWRYVRWLSPDYACGWIVPAVLRGLKMVRRYRPSVIYATGPPHSDLVIAAAISRLTGVPFVADFRDLWMDEPNRPALASWRNWADQKLEKWVVSGADKVISTTVSGAERLSARYPNLPREKFLTIFNGYDLKDMPDVPSGYGERTRMTVCHVGSLYGNRTPAPFLRAMESLAQELPSLRRQLQVRFIGHVEEFAPLLAASPCADMIEATGAVSHAQATGHLASADVLLLIMEPGAELVIPGKIFEYMVSGKPILAAVPLGGETAALLRQAGGATVVDLADVAGIKQALADLHRQWLNSGLRVKRDEAFVQRFERRELTRQLAEVFDECAGS